MPDATDATTARAVASIREIPEAAWDACAGPANPFVRHAFLAALEDSGSVAAATGWLPRHIVLEIASGELIAAAPLYLKSHSYGEYVFDWSWAEAYERAGGRYYPKLQCAVPFTPVTGPRLLVGPAAAAGTARRLADLLIGHAEHCGVSSLHVTFPTAGEQALLADRGFLPRQGRQYYWRNPGYRDFDDFLAALASRKRKAIRKERAGVAETGLRMRRLRGDEIKEHHWHAFYRFYLDTVGRKWAHAYLSRAFFLRLAETMPDAILLVLAETASGQPVAGALNLIGPDALYGRYWGCDSEYRFLHFEVCYYQAIEAAIDWRLGRVEAGAQGEHKIQRGYLPEPTYSAHWIADQRFQAAVARFLAAETVEIARDIQALSALSPYRAAS
jgi:predicted N-acyltransferase